MKVEYISHMGSDLTVVNAARVSFAKESKELAIKDQKLISYLATNNHWTPFGHPTITVRETVPIFVARERYRHVVGFVYNEESRRYITDPPNYHLPSHWRKQAENKKQGSSDEVLLGKEMWEAFSVYDKVHETANVAYKSLLLMGVAPEQARMVLPQTMMTSYYVTGSLAAFARAYKLRSSADAQKEIRQLATGWNEIIKPLYPLSWEALTND